MKQRVNPLSRRPGHKRLVLAVRGAAGTGKSHFAASLADAGVGRLCFFDVERKARLLPEVAGPNPKFDALEVHHPDELLEFIDWALDGEGQEQGYGCYALDSWTMYFGRKYPQTLQAVRDATGDPDRSAERRAACKPTKCSTKRCYADSASTRAAASSSPTKSRRRAKKTRRKTRWAACCR